ncbi:MAG TPA: MFS transporter, partial [Chloroflexota bacterium]|nr:MFS transporter [Chloroflexota bacterium]
YAGTIAGGALAGYMALHFGWRSPFVLLGVAGVALGILLMTQLREPARSSDRQLDEDSTASALEPVAVNGVGQSLADWLRSPTAALLLMAFFGANTVALVFLTWMPTFLKEKFKLDLAHAGLGATVFIQTASMLGSAAGGWMADRWRASRAGGRILVQALGAACGVPCIYYCGLTRNLSSLLAAMTLFGLSKGLYDSNIWASLYDVIPAARRGAAVGGMNMVGWLGGALGAYGIGAAVSQGVSMSAAIASTAVLYAFVAALLLVAASRAATERQSLAAQA